MDELERRLRGEHEAMRDAAPRSGPAVYGAVRAGAKRRRTVRAMLTASVAVVAVGVVGVGAWGLMGDTRAQEPALPDGSPTASGDPSPEPTPTAEPTADPADPRFDDSLDGIAEDSLPALAADRGFLDPADDFSDGTPYPQAHVMEDWVWDAVGAGWALDIASVQWTINYIDNAVLPAAVLYLVSPEDVRFELYELPERAWASTRVTSWREDQGIATIWWADHSEDRDDGQAAAVNLRTGEVSDLRMAVYGETATDYRFIMANAAGDELWRAQSEAGFKYYRWSEGADEDGWVGSALVDEVPDADAAGYSIGIDGPTVTDDGDRVLLRRPLSSEPATTMLTLVTYDLSSDSVAQYPFLGLPEEARLTDPYLLERSLVQAWVEFPENPDSDDNVYTSYPALFALDGSGAVTELADADVFVPDWLELGLPVYFGEATDRSAGFEMCGC
ncbi:hypothetical protein [Demequina sp. NBRC 110056]|uniref:hypothetical protein n=1 Tax=Demequina sp. NBRC 110056 TaxID=1570345 RepID=UPI0009FD5074|nr:hypothetical protein [Demequina sp. NBRC 110056]